MFNSREEYEDEKFVVVVYPKKRKKRRAKRWILAALLLLWMMASMDKQQHPAPGSSAARSDAVTVDLSKLKGETMASYCAVYPAKCR